MFKNKGYSIVIKENVYKFATVIKVCAAKIKKILDTRNTSKVVIFKKMVIMKKNVLSYTTSWINRNFRIKVYGRDENGKRINKLVGVSGILKLIGAELFNKFIKRAVDCMMDSCVCKLRRGLKVTLYVK
mgnify:CR=1 FL=1|jgi:hypothetical protein